ncbi:MAG: coenzyme F420-0:L-glutamate ligase [Frankiaceae bacterium]|nr:coenzyme F420-0:L-glutamate ligase [Frankiaceae bacterium]
MPAQPADHAPAHPADHASALLEVRPILGIGEIRPGDDIAAQIAAAAPWLRDDDVLVVTSKIISKSEDRLIRVDSDDPTAREDVRQTAIESETTRVVARRGPLRIVETRHGFIMAAAGVDASNVARSEIALLPLDPDASAAALRDRLGELLGVRVGVVISDSMGRAWRAGIIDLAIGAAGITALHDVRGVADKFGNVLAVTEVAIADELAAAADLVKGKLGGIPVAVVRGLTLRDDGAGVRPLIRSSADDMFRLGTQEAISVGREDAGGATETPGPLHADAVATIGEMSANANWASPSQGAMQQAFLGFLAARPDAVRRSCVAGHITASAVVIDPSVRSVLLTLHPRVGMWLPVGGHCEAGDKSLLDAAAREAREETGIGSLSIDPIPLALDVHAITCSLEVPTRHFDVQFLALAPPGAQAVISDESLDLRWFPWNELPENSAPELPWLLSLALARLG